MDATRKNTSVFPHGHIHRSGWKRVRLGDVGYTYNGLSGKTKQDFDAGDAFYIPFLNVLENTEIDINNLGRVNVSALEKQTCVQKNDLFFNTSSETPEEVGMCAYLSQELSNTFLNSFCFGFRLYNIHVAEPRFLVYLFNSAYGRRVISSLAQGVTRYNLSKERLLQSDIHLPPVTEQLRIASCINIVEKNLVEMQTLISKYDAIKKATVNLLLKPKAGWERVKLGDVAVTSSGGTPNRSNEGYYQGTIPWFTTSELHDEVLYDSKEHISEEALRKTTAKVFPAGTLLLAMYGATIGKLGVLAKPAATNQACCAIKCGSNVETAFLFQVLINRRQELVALGCGAGQPNISQQIVQNLSLVLPPLSEQRKIAEQIAAIDKVLADYKVQLEKARQLKAGMMSYFFG